MGIILPGELLWLGAGVVAVDVSVGEAVVESSIFVVDVLVHVVVVVAVEDLLLVVELVWVLVGLAFLLDQQFFEG